MLTVQHPKEVAILCPILRDNTLCFVLCLSEAIRQDKIYDNI
ncbi:hypothetical protein GCWU000282_02931 [Catonella morbi ATCC 51271]|uniref:Uncharacterized protein n=2 Tax=Bacillota TaxID=1239 RepID=V2Y0D3_9FIRM|nr:hypothetical protein SIR_1323 [Streptococcus intermedius B196]ESL01517.1 hypothetical protein GCWU000282_03297 [Catonella morbi ATCC 51271]ESL01541.1 hypothetical protein GCWU000282_03295 [Catonella morbi ATCC 51271]ESL01812.1 hypothetical protein GCWU000282_02931 [Catonella morbi ATCC 51271]